MTAENFMVNIGLLDSSGLTLKNSFVVNLDVVGCSDIHGLTTVLYNGEGNLDAPELAILVKGTYFVYASILNSYYGRTQSFSIFYDNPEKYAIITILNTVNFMQITLGSVFSVEVGIYLGSSIYSEVVFNIQLTCMPFYSTFYWMETKETINGLATFNDLKITENGLFVLYAYEPEILSRYSKTINLMLDIYQKISFLAEPVILT